VRTGSGTRTGGQRSGLVIALAAAAALVAPLGALLAEPPASARAAALAQPTALASPPAAHTGAEHPHRGLRVLHPGQYAQLAGTDIYAVVTDARQGIALWGQIVPPGSRSGAGYFFVAQESRVAAGKWAVGGGGGVFVFERQQPAGTPPSSRAHHASGGFTISPGQEMRVDGTSLVLRAARDPQGDPYLASLLMPGRTPLDASYEPTISGGEVAVLRWEAGQPVPVFARSEPASLRTPPVSSTTTTTTAPERRHRGDGRDTASVA
jgi:hypothetical protein